ncbi:MAG: C39 family peptidase [Chloroflexota bacterium]|nr:C39 family peptidase [Chloroflexota bacterium]
MRSIARSRLGWGYRLVLMAAAAAGLFVPRAVQAAPAPVLITGFPSLRQSYSLSCEYAAAEAVTRYWGKVVTQEHFMSEVPTNPNPHLGFRGNIYAAFGGITNYGVYPEPLVPVLEQNGYQAAGYYGDQARLEASLRAGNPVVVWLTSGRQERPLYTGASAGATFRLVPGEHTAVAYGYDSSGINLMDVGNGGYYHTDWASFLRRWGYFDSMMLVITPSGQ